MIDNQLPYHDTNPKIIGQMASKTWVGGDQGLTGRLQLPLVVDEVNSLGRRRNKSSQVTRVFRLATYLYTLGVLVDQFILASLGFSSLGSISR